MQLVEVGEVSVVALVGAVLVIAVAVGVGLGVRGRTGTGWAAVIALVVLLVLGAVTWTYLVDTPPIQ